MKPRRALWGWGGVVLALHALVLLNLPRQTPPLLSPALAHTFATRMVALPAPAPVAVAVAAAAAVPTPIAASAPAQLPATTVPAPRKKAAAPAALPLPRPAPRPAAPGATEGADAAANTHANTDANADAAITAPAPALADPSDLAAPVQSGPPTGADILVAHAAVPAEAGADRADPNPQAETTTIAAGAVSAAPALAAPSATAAPAPEPAAPAPAVAATEALPALAVLAPGAGSAQPGPAPAVQVPAPQQLRFDVTGQAKKFQYSARASLLWQHDGQRYQARQEITLLLLGSRTQTSSGTLGPAGLQPLRFGDRARSEKAAHFDYDQHRVTFSANAPDAPLATGTQDRLSVFVQLGALLAAAPERYPVGTRLQLATAGTGGVDAWTFTVEGEETLNLPLGSLRTLRLQRLPRPDHAYDQQAQLWLAPSLGYLPVRIRITQANGDFADLRLRSHAAP